MLERGSEGDAVRAVQEMLRFLGYSGQLRRGAKLELAGVVPDGDFGEVTESAVVAFQNDQGLYTDGRVGTTTLQALEKAYATRQLELASAGPASARFGGPPGVTSAFDATVGALLPFERCPADEWGDGYDRVWLRADAAAAYRRVYAEARRQGTVLTSSGGRRDLNASVGPNRSATSLHYTGRALDLYVWSAMRDPKADPYVAERVKAGGTGFGPAASRMSPKTKARSQTSAAWATS